MDTIDLQIILGNVIRKIRKQKNLTLKSLSEKAGLSIIYLGEIERGQKYPSASVIKSISDALDIDLVELFVPIAELTWKNNRLNTKPHWEEDHIDLPSLFRIICLLNNENRSIVSKFCFFLLEKQKKQKLNNK